MDKIELGELLGNNEFGVHLIMLGIVILNRNQKMLVCVLLLVNANLVDFFNSGYSIAV